jgi:hypothetical protein
VPFTGTFSTDLPKDDDMKDHYFDQQHSTLAAASEIALAHRKTQHFQRYVCSYPGCARKYPTRDDLRTHRRITGHEEPDLFPPGFSLDILLDATNFHDSMPPPTNLAPPPTLPPSGF